MRILTKAPAEIVPGEDDASSPFGTFDVILSAPTLDRDGDILSPKEWKQPLPDRITFDADHAMSVAGTVGSGTPFLDDAGNLRVRGTYASVPRAQEVRALVNEGHIRSTSVAFMTERIAGNDETPATTTRELLNGAFVAIPANPDAVVLSSKALDPPTGEQILDLIATAERSIVAAKTLLADMTDAPKTLPHKESEPEKKSAADSAAADSAAPKAAESAAAESAADDDSVDLRNMAQAIYLQSLAVEYEFGEMENANAT